MGQKLALCPRAVSAGRVGGVRKRTGAQARNWPVSRSQTGAVVSWNPEKQPAGSAGRCQPACQVRKLGCGGGAEWVAATQFHAQGHPPTSPRTRSLTRPLFKIHRREEEYFDREEVLGRDASSVFPNEIKKANALDPEALKMAIGGDRKFISATEVRDGAEWVGWVAAGVQPDMCVTCTGPQRAWHLLVACVQIAGRAKARCHPQSTTSQA